MKLKEAAVLLWKMSRSLRESMGAWPEQKAGRSLCAEHGLQALEILAANKNDLLVSDVRMLVMDGDALEHGRGEAEGCAANSCGISAAESTRPVLISPKPVCGPRGQGAQGSRITSALPTFRELMATNTFIVTNPLDLIPNSLGTQRDPRLSCPLATTRTRKGLRPCRPLVYAALAVDAREFPAIDRSCCPCGRNQSLEKSAPPLYSSPHTRLVFGPIRSVQTMKKLAFLLVLLGVSPLYAGTLTAAEAKNHVGESATVCGIVASVHFASGSNGSPTFVNLDKPYPNHIFTILIWGDDLPKFKENPAKWQDKKACATGTISSYKGVPEIVVRSQGQITLTPR